MSEKDVIVAMNKGLAKAKAEINSKIEPGQVPFEYGIVIGTLRFYNEHFSDYYKRIISCFPYYTNKEIYQLSAIEAAKLTIYLKENTDINISGFEIGGAEDGYPVEWFKETYNLLKKNLISIKAHAGEASGADSIYNAIGECYVERVGHGLYLYEPSKIKSSEIKDKEKYCKKLVDYIGHKRITIEVCLSSNSQTAPEYNNLTNHPLRKMLNDGISVTLATDNRLICRNTIIQEYEKAIKYCGVSLKEISTIAYEGFVKSFYPGTYVHKMEYLEKVQIAIKNTCNKHGIE
jgi:adenosine deaminase